MFEMFENATLKLTGWYLLIIMVISLIFSALVYQSALGEVNSRLEQFGEQLPDSTGMPSDRQYALLKNDQAKEAAHNILVNLIYINCLILGAGGVASFLMARRTLRPIQEAQEAESRFVSDASHELRTPLAVMKTELEVALKDSSMSTRDMRALLESNLEEVNKLTKLSQTLLSLAKMDYSNLTHEEVPFQPTVLSVIDRYDKHRKRIRFKDRAKPLFIDAHQPSIEELVTVLVDNALKYSPPQSDVHVSLAKRSGKAELRITNAGEGISEDDLPHIFERFYRADHSRTHRNKASFGLGLSLAKTIVELHHGELSATSARSRNTTFTVLLPLSRMATIKSVAVFQNSEKTTTNKQ